MDGWMEGMIDGGKNEKIDGCMGRQIAFAVICTGTLKYDGVMTE